MSDRGSVLVVDDDVGACETLCDILQLKGYRVHTALHGRGGLARMGSDPIDVAIVDINLPDISGLDVLDAVKRASPRTEVIVVTAFASITTAIRAINGAAFAYVAKPFEMDHLLATLGKAEERQRLTRALQESEERYRLVAEHSLDAVFLLDPAGRLVFSNTRGEELTGYRLDEVRGKSITMLLSPEGQGEVTARLAAVRAGREVPTFFEAQVIRGDGTTVWVEASLTTIVRDGHVVGRLGVARDITQRRDAGTALRESEERFRATFEQAAVGIGHTALDGRWLRVNQRLCDIVGYTRDELLTLSYADITHPDDVGLDLEGQRRLLANEIETRSREKRYIHKNGSVVWIDLTASVVRDPAGLPKYLMAVVQDITPRKQLEQELLHAQRMEGVGLLAGGIAHDFNNLLTVVSGRSQLALGRLRGADPLRRDLELIYKTADRAAALTRQLLAFSRKQVLQPRVVDPNALIRDSTNLLTRLIGEDIELTFVPAPDVGRIRVDPGQLEQVIVNLVVNARDAMPQGGRLTIETVNAELDADYATSHVNVTPGRYVMLSVSDTGVGMDPATQARIFEPFFTTKGPGRGTGLGLATVYGIVKQSDGHIRVYSEPGTGTVFRLYLPRTDDVPEAVRPPQAGVRLTGVETVLLVEDEDEVRHLAREVLERGGYTILEAATPADAIAIAERHTGLINLLLTDVVMPRMGGRALATALVPLRPEMRILFMSGYTDDAVIRHGVMEPGTQLIEKPFSPEGLTLKVREVLDAPE